MSSDNTPAKDANVDEEMRRISEVTKPNPGSFTKPSGDKASDRGSNEAAGFSLPFGWGKKKKNEPAPPPAAAPPPPAEQPQAQAPQATQPPQEAAPSAKQERTYTVQAGDTLWDIATEFYGDGRQYPKIARANDIADPDVIHIGAVLKIPD